MESPATPAAASPTPRVNLAGVKRRAVSLLGPRAQIRDSGIVTSPERRSRARESAKALGEKRMPKAADAYRYEVFTTGSIGPFGACFIECRADTLGEVAAKLDRALAEKAKRIAADKARATRKARAAA